MVAKKNDCGQDEDNGLRKDFRQLKASVKFLTGKCVDMSNTINELQKERIEMGSQMKDLRDQLVQTKEENQQMLIKVNEVEAKNNELLELMGKSNTLNKIR